MQIVRIDHDSFALWAAQIEILFNRAVRLNFPQAAVDGSYGREKCQEVGKYLKDGSAIVFAAVEGSHLAGWIWCHEIHRMGIRRLHIAEIAVSDPWQRQGIGKQLLDSAEKYAAEHGYQEIDLLVTVGNQGAVRFYENASFVPERYLMRKTITPGTAPLQE